MNAPSVEIDAVAVINVLQETHPDAVRAAVWRVRAEKAEEALARRDAEPVEGGQE